MYSALWKKNGEQIRPSFISVNATVVDLAAHIVFTKTYSNIGSHFNNNNNEQQEATFKAHLNTTLGVLSGFEIKLDGKKTSAEVVNQAEAMKQFEDAQSNTNIVKEADFNDPFIQEDFFLCKLNNLAAYQELEVIITYVTEMSMQGDYLYMVLPTSLSTVRSTQYFETLPAAPALPNTTLKSSQGDNKQNRQGLVIRLELEMPSSIVEVKSTSHPEGIEANWKDSNGTVVYKDERPVDVVNQSDLIILVKLENPHEPTGFVERNSDGSRALMVVFYPKLEQENKLNGSSSPIAASSSSALSSSPQPPLTPKISKMLQQQHEMELIFLVDCSESMEGYNMVHAKKGLLLFSHSLPRSSYFNIISFGSTHHKLFPQSVPYGEDNLAAANTYIKSLKAETSGGETNLLAPLQDIYKTQPSRPRKIFLLTDGRVSNTGQIAELVRSNAHNTSVFPIAMGEFVSRQLVESIASAGCGVAELVIENETIEGKVMRQLKRALQPAYTNIRIDWGSISSNKQSPRDLRTLFDGDRLTVFNILNKDEKVPESGTVKLMANGPNGPVSFHVNIKGDEFKQGKVIHSLAAYTLILDLETQLQESTDASEIERLKKRIIDLGIKYSLGTSYTSFISLEDPTMANTQGSSTATATSVVQQQNTSSTQSNGTNPLTQSASGLHYIPESAMISLRGSASGIPTNGPSLTSSSSTLNHISNVSPSRPNITPSSTTTTTTTPAPTSTLKPLSSNSLPFTPSKELSASSAPFTPSGTFNKTTLRFDSPEFVPKGMAGKLATTIPINLPTGSTPVKVAPVTANTTTTTTTPSTPVVTPTTTTTAAATNTTTPTTTPVKAPEQSPVTTPTKVSTDSTPTTTPSNNTATATTTTTPALNKSTSSTPIKPTMASIIEQAAQQTPVVVSPPPAAVTPTKSAETPKVTPTKSTTTTPAAATTTTTTATTAETTPVKPTSASVVASTPAETTPVKAAPITAAAVIAAASLIQVENKTPVKSEPYKPPVKTAKTPANATATTETKEQAKVEKVKETPVATPAPVTTPVKQTAAAAIAALANANASAANTATPATAPVGTQINANNSITSTSPPAKRQYTHDYLLSLKDLPSNTIIPEKLKQHAGILNIQPKSSGIFNKEKDRRQKDRHDHGKNAQPVAPPKKIFSKDTQGVYGETFKKFKFNLNRITMDTYTSLVKVIEEIPIPNEEVMSGIAKILFEKAIIDQKYSPVYAILTGHLDSKYPKFETNKSLKREVITNCQKEFELHIKDEYDRSKFDTLSKEDRDEEEFIIKRKFLGNIKFIGELYKHTVLAEAIVSGYCITKLLEKIKASYNEDTIEGLVKMITTIGKKLDADPTKASNQNIFSQINDLSENTNITNRGRYLLLDIMDLRARRWESKDANVSKTVKEENEKEERFVAKHGGGRRGGDDRDSKKDKRDGGKSGLFGKSGSKDGWETVGKGSPKGKQTPKKGDLSSSRDSINTPSKQNNKTPNSKIKKEDSKTSVFSVLDDDEDLPTSPLKTKSPLNTSSSNIQTTATPSTSTTTTAATPAKKQPEISLEKLEDTISMTLDEYLESNDVDEALECIKELNYPTLYSKIICIIVNKSFEKKEKEKALIIELFNAVILSQIYTSDNFKDGYKEILESIEDIEIDLPYASKFLAELIGFSIEAELLPINFLEESYLHLVDTGKAEEMLKETFKGIVKHSDTDRLTELYENANNLDILKLFRPKNRTTQYLQEEFFGTHFPYLSSNGVVVAQSEPTLVEHLILLQKAEGNWQLTKQLAGVLNIPLSDLETAENSDSLARTHPTIWATCLAYSFIETNFDASEQEDLDLIKQKIFDWLNNEYENEDAPQLPLDSALKKAKRLISEY